jgi:hypothetical protein
MESASDFDQLFERKRACDARVAAAPEFAQRLRELRAWQAARLARTYADLRREPRFAAAVDFFLSDLYGTEETTQRDQDLARASRYLKRALPQAALSVLIRAIELDVLSAELDHAMVAALPAGALSDAHYAVTYRAVGNADSRRRQIDLIVDMAAGLDRLVRHVWIGMAVRAAHLPSHAAGFGVLQDFLERGFAAFRNLHGAAPLLQAIHERETRLMQELFAGSCESLQRDYDWRRADS